MDLRRWWLMLTITLPAGFSADSQHMQRLTNASLLLGTGLAVHRRSRPEDQLKDKQTQVAFSFRSSITAAQSWN